MTRETHTAADAERAVRALQRDPAAKGYGDYLRRTGAIGPVPLPRETPASEVSDAEREMRRAMAQRLRL